MEAVEKQIELLMEEGERFTFETFCFRNPKPQYGGESTPAWTSWMVRSFNAVNEVVSEKSPAHLLVRTGTGIQTRGHVERYFRKAKADILEALRLALETSNDDKFGELKQAEVQDAAAAVSNRVFVVHGHDDTLKTEVEVFLREIGLEPVVLHRQPDQGKTIIEKFEANSDVGYAFILLTPDEIAYVADEEQKEDAKRRKERRARPNVIFEFGYFVGKLGRGRVCCLYKGDVQLPSDLQGLVYKEIASNLEEQGYAILKELKAAGYEVEISSSHANPDAGKGGGSKQ